jgi:pSer/pThr/pTyr-binding forkhead associated (FHA) protein
MARVKKCPVCGTNNKPNAPFCKNDRVSLQNISPTLEEEIKNDDEPMEAEAAEAILEELCPNPICRQPILPERSDCVYCNTPLLNEQQNIPINHPSISTVTSLKLEINGKLFEVEKRIVFGRDESISPIASLVPQELDNISRRHAELWVDSDKAYVRDLNSTNGTFVNERKIPPDNNTLLHDGDSIRFAANLTARVRICHA